MASFVRWIVLLIYFKENSFEEVLMYPSSYQNPF